jgi:hypothetical protein
MAEAVTNGREQLTVSECAFGLIPFVQILREDKLGT